VDVFNGFGSGPIVCDATEITASVITPDGVNHPLILTRTALSNSDRDSYHDVVTYTARTADVKSDGTLVATAKDTGIIHQNDANSQGGGNQGVNVTAIMNPVVPAIIHVIKQVVNTGGGSGTASDFLLHLKLAGTDVAGSPHAGTVTPGTEYSVIAGAYSVSEESTSTYTKSFSGDCDSSGNISLAAGDDKNCTIVNTYIPVIVTPVVSPVPPVTPPVVTPTTVVYSGGGSGSNYNAPIVAATPVAVPVSIPIVQPVTIAPPATIIQPATIAPSFPNTGFPPKDNSNFLDTVELIVILMLLSISSVVLVKTVKS
jgi:hypothetical protein